MKKNYSIPSISKRDATRFQKNILKWYEKEGRHTLPWQLEAEAYPIWLSEIMLQQTQVQTVIPYYHKFLQRFPHIEDLAAASIEEVLSLWAGLGYYARGRNLHATAQIVCAQHQGRFPRTLEALMALPGIGRSTAGAILAQSYEIQAPILDANVKRVLCRFHAIQEAPDKALWEIASAYTPTQSLRNYTQAMMDLGALVCRQAQPDCARCPLQKQCAGYASGDPSQFPEKKARAAIPTRRSTFACIIENQRKVLLQKRPDKGIWGGLWCLPEWDEASPATKHPHTISGTKKHSFTHFHLHYQLRQIHLKKCPQTIEKHWPNAELVDIMAALSRGLPTPMQKVLRALAEEFA